MSVTIGEIRGDPWRKVRSVKLHPVYPGSHSRSMYAVVKLECGHTNYYKASRAPRHRARCMDCPREKKKR